MVKKSVAHPYYGIQLSNTKELTVGMQKLGCIARELFEWEKSQSQQVIYHMISIYIIASKMTKVRRTD